MAFLLQRLKSADGDWTPEYAKLGDTGMLSYENTEAKAIKSYARRHMGGEDQLQEGDVFTFQKIEDETYEVACKSKRTSFKFGPADDE